MLFCGWANNYISISVQKLNNLVCVLPVTNILLTETVQYLSYLAYLSMASNLVALISGRLYKNVCKHSTITILFQKCLLTCNQIINLREEDGKLSISYFYNAKTNKVDSIWKLFRQFEREKKNNEKHQFGIWFDVKEIGVKQKRSTKGCSKPKSSETKQVQERLVSTL